MTNQLYIEITAYHGRNGSYGFRREPLWLARIVGVDGTKRLCDPSSWHGCPDHAHVLGLACGWANFLGVLVRHVEGAESPSGMPPP